MFNVCSEFLFFIIIQHNELCQLTDLQATTY
jgi:hypothetical protein